MAGVKARCGAGSLAPALRLRKRLVRRGVAPGFLPIAAPLLEQGIPPAVPGALLESTGRAAMATVLAGRAAPTATTVISASVVALARSVNRAMAVSKAASLAAAFVAITAGILLLGLIRSGVSATLLDRQKGASAPARNAPPPQAQKPDSYQIELRAQSRRDKQPLAQAAIGVSYWDDGAPHELSRTTDSQGSCRFGLPRTVAQFAIYTAKDGFVPTEDIWPERRILQGVPVTVVQELDPGSPIGGFVADERGQPIVEAEVTVAIDRGTSSPPDIDLPNGSSRSLYAAFASIRVKTGAQGRWQCSILPEDAEGNVRLWLRVSHRDFVNDSGGYSRRLSVKTARSMTATLTMRAGLRVAGHVHGAHGQAVPGATVTLAYSASSGNFLRTKTDAAGRFLFAHADEKASLERFSVSVEAAGFAPAWKVLVPRDGIPDLDFELAPARPFSGRVVDSQGNAVADALVEPKWQECHFIEWNATTDSDGRFVWLERPDGRRNRVHCAKIGLSACTRPLSRCQGRRGDDHAQSSRSSSRFGDGREDRATHPGFPGD